MEITADPREDHVVLRLHGEFDIAECPTFLAEIQSRIDGGVRAVALDLRQVSFINSTAVGALLQASNDLRARGGVLAVVEASEFCRTLFSTIGLARRIPIHASEEEGAAAFRARE